MDILFAKRTQAKSDNNRMIYNIKLRYQIKIPQIVIGEIVVKIIERTSNLNGNDKQSYKLSCFFELVQDMTNLNDNSPPVDRDILTTALTLVSNDDRDMDYCDAIITSFALTSNENCDLLTSDRSIHESQIVSEKIIARKKEGIKIKIIDGTDIN